MMSLQNVSLSIFGISLVGLAIVLARKFPAAASIDVTAAKDSHQERKSRLIETRLKRKFVGFWSTVSTKSDPAVRGARTIWDRTHQKLVDLEQEYKIRSLPVFLSRRQRQKVDADIQRLTDQAIACMETGEYTAAEEKCLQAIRLEPRSVPAFELLADMYMQMKEYGHAKEIYLYLHKLVREPDAIFAHGPDALSAEPSTDSVGASATSEPLHKYDLYMAKAYRGLADWPNAFACIQESARREPNNPKVLDEYIEISIGYEKKGFAEDALARLAETNPDNSKIADWKERIAALPDHPLPRTTFDATIDTDDHSIDRSSTI